ncbi:MAG: FapA family protein [Spirochaetes bacterium]|nr:FapA family protein [Spirochaetota bacterium]
MSNLKNFLKNIEDEGQDSSSGNDVEVFADSVKQALELASRELNADISMLDYEILEKGTPGLLGIGRKPYHLLVRQSESGGQYKDVLDIEKKLSKVSIGDDIQLIKSGENIDGKCKIRVSKSGIWLTVSAPKGRGKRIELSDVREQLNILRISNVDNKKIEKAVSSRSGKPVKIGEWIPNPENDSRLSIEMSDDEMKVYVKIAKPRFSGRHLDVDDVIESLKQAGVVTGINEEQIAKYLDDMDYSSVLVGAEGVKPKHGRDAYIDYKVRIDKSRTVFEEDEKGQVDFKDLDLLENVVVGQLLAVKVPLEEGVPGRTVTNRVLPAKSGKDIALKYGKGTILSEDGLELTAEINGQVVYQHSKISVDPVHIVKGDVSLETGNIVFLGSVLITGNVQDNFIVKSAGNIEVRGSVQKAFLEAEGNIIVRQGIVGREEAKIESTGGSIYAKFIQSANVIVEKDVIVPEGILHSNVDAGSRIICTGRRAKIMGGVIRAGEEVNARYLGSDTFTKTEISVGINPKVLQQMTDLRTVLKESNDELEKLNLDLNTLKIHRAGSGQKLPADKEELYNKLLSQKQKLTGRIQEITIELEELKAYLNILEQKGKVCAEQCIYPGVDIHIKDEKFSVRDQYSHVKISMENDSIKIFEYEPPKFTDDQTKMMAYTRLKRKQ